MKNTKFNQLLKTEPYSDGTYWTLGYRYIKGISEFDLEVTPSTKITEDNINTIFKAFKIPANVIEMLENMTHGDLLLILGGYAEKHGFEINYLMVDPDTEAREAQLEKLGLGE